VEKSEFLKLIDKMLAGKSSKAEDEMLMKYYNSFQQQHSWEELGLGDKKAFEAAALEKLQYKIKLKRPTVVSLISRYSIAAAASVLFLLALVIWLMTDTQKVANPVSTAKVIKNDIKAPETNRATITLSNGRTLYLDSFKNGKLLAVDGVEIDKLEDGKLQYRGNSTSAIFNTLNNPKGSRPIDITLADGSRVWLNAASSVTFPVAFAGNERKVEINGEAYLEVAHDASKPFVVKKGNMQVQVLGTKFNVNAYNDEENIKITLLEGSVSVNSTASTGVSSKPVKIKPGQQAKFTELTIAVDNDINIEEVMAWKNGIFKFNDVTIEPLMRQIEKWYGVEVVYEGKVNSHFIATIPKTVSAENVFKILEQTGGVHFRIEGTKVVVMP
jgi:transmembrane sensor